MKTYCKTEKAKELLCLFDNKTSTLSMVLDLYRNNGVDTDQMLDAIKNEGVSSITDEYSFVESVNNLISNCAAFEQHISDKPFDYYRPGDKRNMMNDVEYLLHVTVASIFKYKNRLLMNQ